MLSVAIINLQSHDWGETTIFSQSMVLISGILSNIPELKRLFYLKISQHQHLHF